MTHRYLDGRLGSVVENAPLRARVESVLAGSAPEALPLGLDDLSRGLALVREIDGFIEETQPFRLAKDPSRAGEVAEILYGCAETFRIASLWLWPALSGQMEEVWRRTGLEYGAALADRGRGDRAAWSAWGGLPGGSALAKGDPLFPRHPTEA